MSIVTPGRGEGLSARKRDILRRVIDSYVREIKPVSSQQVAGMLNVSSATIRNEMAALEELGYLRQPHTSGGRIPTDKAYRFLVEDLLEHLAGTVDQRSRVAGVYEQLGSQTEALLEGTLDLLTEMTGYVAWVSLPTPTTLDIRAINFVEVDTHDLLIVLVTGGGVMQSRMLRVDVPAKDLSLGRLAEALNTYLRGRSVLEVDYDELRRIYREMLQVPEAILGTLQEFFTSLADSRERVMFGNALQLALQPEFMRVEQLNNIIAAIQDKERFIRSLRQQFSERRVQTIIGTENEDPNLHECSLVLSRYAVPEHGEGTIGVLGPTRLLYDRTLPWVKVIGEAVAGALETAASGDKQEQ